MVERNFKIYANCPEQYNVNAIEMHGIKDRGFDGVDSNSHSVLSSLKQEIASIVDGPGWLPLAAEQYNISPRISDYVLKPVAIMPSELPNRNGIGFPFRELSRFSPDYGRVAYRSWKGKPTHVEHKNKDYTIAKGVVFDVAFRPIAKAQGNLWKVITLCGFDRTRDADLVNDILTGKRPSFSMGAMCRDYQCSICGSLHTNGGCEHVTLGKPEFKVFNNHLAYLEALDPCGFEVSSVATPAYVSATTPHTIRMW